MGGTDEQSQTLSTGNRDGGSDLRLEFYDRSNEDKSLPFFGKDEVINEILRTTPHLSASLEDIKNFYERNLDNSARTEYIKSIFNNDYTELTLEDGRTVGYKTFQNVLHLWEGTYDNRTAQSYFNWEVIAMHFEAMRLLGELSDRIKPLPSVDGQMSLILEGQAEANKTSAFTFSQEIIDAVLTRGSGIEEGKMRIYEQFSKSLSAKENADFLREEYGWGGSYPVIIGTGIDENHDGKGITLSRGMGNDKSHILMNWNQVAKRIGELISADRYLNPKEKEHYPQWLEKQEQRRAALAEQQKNREILNSAPPEQVNNTTEQQNNTSEEIIGKEVTIDGHRFVIESVGSFSGDVSMRDVTMQGQRIPINRVEKIGYVRHLLEEQSKDTEEKHYAYHLGDSVYIGASQYEILSFDDNRVMLYDFEYPLFNKEFSREEFDRKVRENPMNDHLIAKNEIEIRFSSNEFEKLIPQGMRYKQVELVNGNEIYWVTQNVFTVSELEEFQKAIRDYDGNIEKFYVTSRSISPSYDYEDDRANNILATVTADTIVAEPYVNAIREAGLGEYLEEEKEEAPITEVETNMGTMPIEDYREVVASQAGFDSYDEMYDEGIRIGNGYDKEPEPEETNVTVTEQEIHTPELEPVTPKWEQKKKPNSFDLHPDIPLSDRHTFDLKSNPVEEVGKKERFRRNIMAIQLLKKCQEENRFATVEEQQILSKYVGWGGLSEAFDENNSAWRTEFLELSTVLTPEEYAW